MIIKKCGYCKEKNNLRNKQEGITLVALIVTIIILLILSGIALNITLRRKWIT